MLVSTSPQAGHARQSTDLAAYLTDSLAVDHTTHSKRVIHRMGRKQCRNLVQPPIDLSAL